MPHDARLDGILWPAMRDRLIFSSGKIDLQGVLASLESGEAVVVHATGVSLNDYSQSLESGVQPMLIAETRLSLSGSHGSGCMGSLGSVRTRLPVSPGVLRNMNRIQLKAQSRTIAFCFNSGLLDGEILKVCNKWRSARGETQIAL